MRGVAVNQLEQRIVRHSRAALLLLIVVGAVFIWVGMHFYPGGTGQSAAGQSSTSVYDDVDVSGVHAPAIESLRADGIFAGTACRSNSFCPGHGIKRWQMAVWLVRVLDDRAPKNTGSTFDDLDSVPSWAIKYVERLAELSVTKGCSLKSFCPQNDVTRGQMALFLTRAFNLRADSSVEEFKDVGIGDLYFRSVQALITTSVTAGCRSDRFCPGQATTKAQMATFIYRARNIDVRSSRIGYYSRQGGKIYVAYGGNARWADLTGDNSISDEEECLGDLCSNLYWLDQDPSWSQDGQSIAFASDRESRSDGFTFDLYTMRFDGTFVRRLTINGDVASPTWSPDGTHIAYDDNERIYIINTDGHNRNFLTNGSNPTWSPDGTRIAYDDNERIYIINTDGRNRNFLTNGSNPNWSPDGTRVALESTYLYGGTIYDIYSSLESSGIVVVNADGTNHFRLADDAYAPTWAPR